jgi:hypothetical protein
MIKIIMIVLMKLLKLDPIETMLFTSILKEKKVFKQHKHTVLQILLHKKERGAITWVQKKYLKDILGLSKQDG